MVIICTREEAIKEINKQRGLEQIGFRVFVKPFLPVSDEQGFSGLTSVAVSKKVFINAISACLINFEDRGARIELTVPEQDYGSFYIG